MNPLIFDDNFPVILNREMVEEKGIELSNLERVALGQTPLFSSISSIQEGLRKVAEEVDGKIILLVNEKSYGGMFQDKFEYSYEVYR
ncbi:hypothetical protein HN832_03670 [archaeon]|nr:hypothetical protein [archaeon]MBT4373506.1 hypothetical protein [archaeon]MBT4531954.1 hypothetical protein [archaeon]MBT7001621.1 hypothetical protein [archaeon]MBT7282487.1 hypothetical protein [archaeon]